MVTRNEGRGMCNITRRALTFAAPGLAIAWSSLAHAQNPARLPTIGILWGGSKDSGPGAYIDTFVESLRELGWNENGNIAIQKTWGNNETQLIVAAARKLIEMRPDVILAGPTASVIPLKELKPNIPIVFVSVSDPVGSGIINSLSRPGVNITGFTNLDLSISGKWVQLLKTVSPATEKIGMMISTSNPVSPRWFQALAQLASEMSFEAISLPVTTLEDVRRALDRMQSGRSALVVPGDTFLSRLEIRAELLRSLSDRSLPAVFGEHEFARAGGLMSYGFDPRQQFRLAGAYVSRILRGEVIENLPVQQPNKYELIVNMTSAKMLGVSVPPLLLALAEELIN